MIVPDLSGAQSANETLSAAPEENVPAASQVADISDSDVPEPIRKTRNFGRIGRLNGMGGNQQSIPAKTENHLTGLEERQSCPGGSNFYSCANGFRGCCSMEPCNPGGGCPDGAHNSGETTSGNNAATSQDGEAQTSTADTQERSLTTPATATSNGRPGMLTATRSATASAPTLTTLASDAPSCPGGNNTIYEDSLRIPYNIQCNADSTADSYDSIDVNRGGYTACFAACSTRSDCAGFMFSGLEGGTCYFKNEVPANSFERGKGQNYISASKTNSTAVAEPEASSGATSPADSSSGGATNTGAIVGGVMGGFAFLLLLLFLLAFCARRRRKKIEERRSATVATQMCGPVETERLHNFPPDSNNSQYMRKRDNGYTFGHGRQGSTAVANDLFAPYGGFYRGTQNQSPRGDESHGTSQPPVTSSNEKGVGGLMLEPAICTHPTAKRTVDRVAMLDSTPITPLQQCQKTPPARAPIYTSQSSNTSSPRFREHFTYEMADTSPRLPSAPSTPSDTDSPTLGRDTGISGPVGPLTLADQVRRKQHLMSWNNYHGAHEMEAGGEGSVEGTMGREPRTPPGQRGAGAEAAPFSPPAPVGRGFGRESMVSPFRGCGTGSRG